MCAHGTTLPSRSRTHTCSHYLITNLTDQPSLTSTITAYRLPVVSTCGTLTYHGLCNIYRQRAPSPTGSNSSAGSRKRDRLADLRDKKSTKRITRSNKPSLESVMDKLVDMSTTQVNQSALLSKTCLLFATQLILSARILQR